MIGRRRTAHDALDSGTVGPLLHRFEERVKIARVALGGYLDRPGWEIAHPSAKAERVRSLADEPPKPDSLYASDDLDVDGRHSSPRFAARPPDGRDHGLQNVILVAGGGSAFEGNLARAKASRHALEQIRQVRARRRRFDVCHRGFRRRRLGGTQPLGGLELPRGHRRG